MAKKGLGRGLDALLADNAIEEKAQSGVTMLKISDVEPNRAQARTYFDETALLFDKITVSAGVRGCQLYLNPAELIEFINAQTADLTV